MFEKRKRSECRLYKMLVACDYSSILISINIEYQWSRIKTGYLLFFIFLIYFMLEHEKDKWHKNKNRKFVGYPEQLSKSTYLVLIRDHQYIFSRKNSDIKSNIDIVQFKFVNFQTSNNVSSICMQ